MKIAQEKDSPGPPPSPHPGLGFVVCFFTLNAAFQGRFCCAAVAVVEADAIEALKAGGVQCLPVLRLVPSCPPHSSVTASVLFSGSSNQLKRYLSLRFPG